MAKSQKKRAEKYEKKIVLKEGVTFDQLVDLAVKHKPQEAKTKPKN